MSLFGLLSRSYKGIHKEEGDLSSVHSTASTRAPTPPRFPPQQIQDPHEAQAHILMQLSETEWHLRQHQAAFATLQVDFTAQIKSMEGRVSKQLEVVRLNCNKDIAQVNHDLAQQSRNFIQRLDVLNAKQDDSVTQRIDVLAGRLQLTNLKVEQMSQATPVAGGVEAVNVEGQESFQDCLRRLKEFGERLDRMDAKLDGFYSVQAISNSGATDSTTQKQLLDLGCRLDIVDSKVSTVLSYTDGMGAPRNKSEDANVRLRDNLVNQEQMTRDFAAKLCGVSERLQVLEEQLSQNLQNSRGVFGADDHSFLLQHMINYVVVALKEDTQQLADLQKHYVEQRKQVKIYTDNQIIAI